jgi:hypothetical protein
VQQDQPLQRAAEIGLAVAIHVAKHEGIAAGILVTKLAGVMLSIEIDLCFAAVADMLASD